MEKSVILFDGVCGLCNKSVNYIIDHDYKNSFMFASLQSEAAKKLLEPHNISNEALNSIILVHKNRVYQKSDAVLIIAKHLKGISRFLLVGYVLPRFLRNFFYDFIAKRRYKWFGKYDACRMPTPEMKAKFL
jgi:predicted DCC family thiol-disulfide oxidoreductase YuxK